MNDSHFIAKAISLALKGKFNTKPGVNVGCVIVKNNKIIGQGFYEKYGGSHAEINAINQVKRKYKKSFLSKLAGSDIFVTLEPCSKKGKTGACVNELKKYAFNRIIIGAKDPTQDGFKKLQHAGYEVIDLDNHQCLQSKVISSSDGTVAYHLSSENFNLLREIQNDMQENYDLISSELRR